MWLVNLRNRNLLFQAMKRRMERVICFITTYVGIFMPCVLNLRCERCHFIFGLIVNLNKAALLSTQLFLFPHTHTFNWHVLWLGLASPGWYVSEPSEIHLKHDACATSALHAADSSDGIVPCPCPIMRDHCRSTWQNSMKRGPITYPSWSILHVRCSKHLSNLWTSLTSGVSRHHFIPTHTPLCHYRMRSTSQWSLPGQKSSFFSISEIWGCRLPCFEDGF